MFGNGGVGEEGIERELNEAASQSRRATTQPGPNHVPQTPNSHPGSSVCCILSLYSAQFAGYDSLDHAYGSLSIVRSSSVVARLASSWTLVALLLVATMPAFSSSSAVVRFALWR